jgi:uncharacterized protein DUF5666
MRGQGWMTPWRWGVSLVAVAALVLAGCGSGSSPSRQATDISGPSINDASQSAKSGGVGNGNGRGNGNDDGNRGNGNSDGNGNSGPGSANSGSGSGNSGPGNGNARGRPVGELRGVVAGKTGVCPSITFAVNGTPVRTAGGTEYENTTCQTLANGNLVKVEGQPLGSGAVLAREIELLTGGAVAAAGNVVGATVALFQGGTQVATDLTSATGKFEFEDVAQGTYDLMATRVGATTCTPAVLLRSGVLLVARQNEVEGTLSSTATVPTCTTLVLNHLQVRQGND